MTGEETVNGRNSGPDLKASIRELAAVLEGGLKEHPTPAELQDFLAGDLPEDQRDRIEEHLALCRTCARAALDLADFAELPELEPVQRGELLSESELAAQWQRFRIAVNPVAQPRRKWILALAAALLLGIVGLVVWGARERQDHPRADVYVAFLDEAVTRSSSHPDPIRRPSWAGRIVFIVNLDAPKYSEYGIEIIAADGRKIWSERGIPRQDESVAVEVPVGHLPEGTYQIRLSGPQGQPVSEHAVKIEPG